MPHSPGPIQSAGTLTGSGTTDIVLTSSDLLTVCLNLNVVTAATLTIGITPLGGSNIALAIKVLPAGAQLTYDGIALGVGDRLTVLSTQVDTTYTVFTSESPKPGIQVTSSSGGISTGGTDRIQATYYLSTTLAAVLDRVFYVATRPVQVTAISCVFPVAAGGASVIQVTKDTGTDAPGAGTDLLTNNSNTGFDLNGTANTVQTGGLSATAANLVLAAGDRLAVDYANAIQSTTGLCITVDMTVL